jgi:hypothetical protein
VLSFPLNDNGLLGELAISADRAPLRRESSAIRSSTRFEF